jgi:hypothetical protein
MVSQSALGEDPSPEDNLTRFGRPLEDVETIYVGEDDIQIYIEFKNEWLNYSMDLVSDLSAHDVHIYYDNSGPWYPGNQTWWSFPFDWEALPGTYDATLILNRTYPNGTKETVRRVMTIEYVVAIEITDIYLVRANRFMLRFEIDVLVDCTDFNIWLAPMPHHDAEIEEWHLDHCPPGHYVFETPLPGGSPYPGAPPDNVDVSVWANASGYFVDIYREEEDLRIEIEGTGGLGFFFLIAIVIAMIIAVVYFFLKRKGRRMDRTVEQ